MIDTLISKAKGFILAPAETFRQSAEDEPSAVFTYFGALLLIHALLSAAIVALGIGGLKHYYVGIPQGAAFPVVVFIMMLVGGCIVTLVFAVWLHLWVYLLGGRKGLTKTVNAVIYGSTPRLIFGWIPFIGIIFALWSLLLGVLGIRELQGLSPGRAILAVVIAILIPLIILILLGAWLMASVVTAGSVTTVPSFTMQ